MTEPSIAAEKSPAQVAREQKIEHVLNRSILEISAARALAEAMFGTDDLMCMFLIDPHGNALIDIHPTSVLPEKLRTGAPSLVSTDGSAPVVFGSCNPNSFDVPPKMKGLWLVATDVTSLDTTDRAMLFARVNCFKEPPTREELGLGPALTTKHVGQA